VRELTLRAAGFLAENGIAPQQKVILFSNNMPEWGLAYFGILKAGAVAVPLDPSSSAEDVAKFAKASEASAIIISQKLLDENPELKERRHPDGNERAVRSNRVYYQLCRLGGVCQQDAGVPKL